MHLYFLWLLQAAPPQGYPQCGWRLTLQSWQARGQSWGVQTASCLGAWRHEFLDSVASSGHAPIASQLTAALEVLDPWLSQLPPLSQIIRAYR